MKHPKRGYKKMPEKQRVVILMSKREGLTNNSGQMSSAEHPTNPY